MPTKLFKPGESGNPAGKPKGTLTHWNKKMGDILGKHFDRFGKCVLDRLKEQDPVKYMEIMIEFLKLQQTKAQEDPTRGGVTNIQNNFYEQTTSEKFVNQALGKREDD